jgi:hypothetical protein
MDPWRQLVEAFVSGEVDARAFETEFLALHLAEVNRGHSIPFAVDQLFYEVDAYCADPRLRGDLDIDEAELLAAARKSLAEWEKPWPQLPEHGSR